MGHPGNYDYRPDKRNTLLGAGAYGGWEGKPGTVEVWTSSIAVALSVKEAKKLHKQLGKLIKYVENKEAE